MRKWLRLVAAAMTALGVGGLVEAQGEARSAADIGMVVYAVVGECDDQEPDCAGIWLESVRPGSPQSRDVLTCREGGCLATNPDVSRSGRIVYGGGDILRVISPMSRAPKVVVRDGRDPAWAPGGGHIVFGRVRARGGAAVPDDYALYIKRLGGGVRRLTAGELPDWSARGQIAFVREDERSPPDVYVVGSNGLEVRRLTRGGRGSAPSWAPDGRRLAIERRVGGKTNIAIIDRRGRTLRVLTRKGGRTPAWSPDGRQIAFYRPDREFQNNGSVYVIGARGGGLRRVARWVGYPAGIDWGP
jgi:hypothetical protein